jgi:two-component system chemotaxis sensor kinase CheA
MLQNNETLPYHGGVLPLVRLSKLLGISERVRRTPYALVIQSGSQPVSFAVDRLLGQREIVVRALNDPLLQVPGFSGAAELGDGSLVLILDPAALIALSQEKKRLMAYGGYEERERERGR